MGLEIVDFFHLYSAPCPTDSHTGTPTVAPRPPRLFIMTKSLVLAVASVLVSAADASVKPTQLLKHPHSVHTTPLNHDVIVDQMRLAADYFIATETSEVRYDCGWQHGAFLQGIMALYDATHDMKYKDYALSWAEENNFLTCRYPDTLKQHDAANWESCGQTYAELYFLDHNDTYISNIEEVLAVQVNRSQVDDWWWVDAFFMAMGTFSRIGSCPVHCLHG